MPLAALALAASLSFSQYLGGVDAAFDASPLAHSLRLAQRGAREGARERVSESPLRLSATASATVATQTGLGLRAPQSGLVVAPSLSAAYATRSGLSATLSGSYDLSDPPADVPSEQGFDPFSVSLDVRYDITQGGPRAPARLEASGAAASSTAQGHDAAQQLLDERIAFGQLMIDVYSAHCVVALLSDARRQIDETVASAGLKLETGIMGQRDFLNFASLENSFAVQQVQLEATLLERLQAARGYGRAASELAEAAGREAACDVDIEATQTLARHQLLSALELERAGAALPASQSARESLRAAAFNQEAVSRRQRVSVSPFVTAQVTRLDYSTQNLVQVVGGVAIEWTVPTARQGHARQEAALSSASARTREQDAQLRARASLLQLNAQLESQVRVFDVLSKALRDSARLIEVLKAQQLIGAVDSLNYATAYLNDVALRQSLLSAWASAQRGVFALKVYRAAAQPGG